MIMKTTNKLVTFVLLSFLICSIPMFGQSLSKKHSVKGTKWTCRSELFVADAGTMTIIQTIHFVDKKNVKIFTKTSMPAHPASYMLSDGTVPVIEGRESEFEDVGTYTVKCNKIKIQLQKSKREFTFKDGCLIENDSQEDKFFRE